MEHQVVAKDRRVLVEAQGQVPAHLRRVGPVEPDEVLDLDVDGSARSGPAAEALAGDHNAEAGEVEQRLADLSDLPVQHRDHPRPPEEEVAHVVVAVDQRRLALCRHFLGQTQAELWRPPGQVGRRPLHQPGPAHHLAVQRHRLLLADPGRRDRHRVQSLEHLDRGGGQLERLLARRGELDPIAVDGLHQHEGPAVDDRFRRDRRDRRDRQTAGVERGHDPALPGDVGRPRRPRAGRRQPEHIAALAGGLVDVDPVGEAGMALGDRLDAADDQFGLVPAAPELALEVGSDRLH